MTEQTETKPTSLRNAGVATFGIYVDPEPRKPLKGLITNNGSLDYQPNEVARRADILANLANGFSYNNGYRDENDVFVPIRGVRGEYKVGEAIQTLTFRHEEAQGNTYSSIRREQDGEILEAICLKNGEATYLGGNFTRTSASAVTDIVAQFAEDIHGSQTYGPVIEPKGY